MYNVLLRSGLCLTVSLVFPERTRKHWYRFLWHLVAAAEIWARCVCLTRLCHLEALSPKWSVQITPAVSPSKLLTTNRSCPFFSSRFSCSYLAGSPTKQPSVCRSSWEAFWFTIKITLDEPLIHGAGPCHCSVVEILRKKWFGTCGSVWGKLWKLELADWGFWW